MRIEQHIVAAWASKLADRVIGETIGDLQKMDSDDMLSGDSRLKNVWEEICIQVQSEHSVFLGSYTDTIETLLARNVELLDSDALQALWSTTDEGWNFFYDHHADDDDSIGIPYDKSEVVAMLMDRLLSVAEDYESTGITRFFDESGELDDDEIEDGDEVADERGSACKEEKCTEDTINKQSRATNLLQLSLAEFKRATKVFTPKRLKLGPALLAFEGGFLSIESGEVTAVMRATGEWHGRATFSPQTLRAIATVPPSQDPLTISYSDGHLLIANMTIACEWHPVSERFIHNLENPSLFDLLVIERTLPRAEIGSTELGQRVTAASKDANKRIRKAVSQLADLHVTEAELLALVDSKIKARLKLG